MAETKQVPIFCHHQQYVAIQYIRQLYQDRGYRMETWGLFPRGKMIHIYILNQNDKWCMALLTSMFNVYLNNPFYWINEEKDKDLDYPVFTTLEGKKLSTGCDMMTALIEHCNTNKIQDLIVVSNSMSNQASKLALDPVESVSTRLIQLLDYDQTAIPQMGNHTLHPMVIRLATPEESSKLDKEHLPRIRSTDVLVQHLGFRQGQIVYVEENNNNLNWSKEFVKLV